MCSQFDDPTQYDRPEPTHCEGRYWSRGADQLCTRTVALTRWQDTSGVPHAGCPQHAGGLLRRYPTTLPESVARHGTLSLSTPWARGAFGPADRIEVENLIPEGWTIGVSAFQGKHGRFTLRLLAPSKALKAAWENRTEPVPAARQLAEFAQRLAGDPVEPEWLHEQVDPVTAAKAEADRSHTYASEPWTVGADGGASVALSYMRSERAAR